MQVWVAFAALMVTLFVVSGTGLWALFSKMEKNRISLERVISDHKANLDAEVEALRTAAFLEYKELRREMTDAIQKAYLDFGEAPRALREKISQVELFMRDTYLPTRLYERAQDQVTKALEDLEEHLETRLVGFEKKLDKMIEQQT